MRIRAIVAAAVAAALAGTAFLDSADAQVQRDECTTVRGSGYGLTQKSALTSARKDAHSKAREFYGADRLSIRSESEFKEECGNGIVLQACSYSMKACKQPRTIRNR
jgi:hypothetical protein